MIEKNKNEKYRGESRLAILIRQTLAYLFIIAFTVLLIFIVFKWASIHKFLQMLMKIMAPVIAGLGIGYVLLPVVHFAQDHIKRLNLFKQCKNEEKAKKIVRGLSVGCALIFAILICVILGMLIVPELVKSIYLIIARFPSYTQQIAEYFGHMQSGTGVSQDLQNVVNQAMDYLQQWMQNDLYPQLMDGLNIFTESIMGLLTFAYNILIGAIISIYVMMSADTFTGQMKKIMFALFKPNIANSFIDVGRHCNHIFGGFISGKLIDSAIIGVICFIVLNLIHMPYAMLVSVIVGVTNVIPFFGPYIGAIPSVLLIGLTDLRQGIIFLVFIIILQQIDGNIIGPKILGDSTGLSPFWVVFSILVGGGLFGFLGMLLGVPVFAVIYYLIKTFIEYRLVRRNMPIETDVYIHAHGYDSKTEQLVYVGNEEEETSEDK